MARRQMQIPGTERKVIDEIEKAAEAYREVRDERCELSRREKQKKLELLAVMRAHKVTRYKYDDENGEEILVALDEREPEVKVQRTGEAEWGIGEGISSGEAAKPAGMEGLINEALKAQSETGVAEDDDGNVVPPDVPAPKKRKARKAKR